MDLKFSIADIAQIIAMVVGIITIIRASKKNTDSKDAKDNALVVLLDKLIEKTADIKIDTHKIHKAQNAYTLQLKDHDSGMSIVERQQALDSRTLEDIEETQKEDHKQIHSHIEKSEIAITTLIKEKVKGN